VSGCSLVSRLRGLAHHKLPKWSGEFFGILNASNGRQQS